MDLRKLKTLIDLVAESGIAELEITEGEDKVRIVKSSSAAMPVQTHSVFSTSGMAGSMAGMAEASAPGLAAAKEAEAAVPLGRVIKSPMVGTFYRSAAPGTEPFVSIGTEVKEGQSICVIEAMKLMNEIPADTAGVIKEILVENGQPVEFGQPLFVLA